MVLLYLRYVSVSFPSVFRYSENSGGFFSDCCPTVVRLYSDVLTLVLRYMEALR